jgi:hypothetical protein
MLNEWNHIITKSLTAHGLTKPIAPCVIVFIQRQWHSHKQEDNSPYKDIQDLITIIAKHSPPFKTSPDMFPLLQNLTPRWRRWWRHHGAPLLRRMVGNELVAGCLISKVYRGGIKIKVFRAVQEILFRKSKRSLPDNAKCRTSVVEEL